MTDPFQRSDWDSMAEPCEPNESEPLHPALSDLLRNAVDEAIRTGRSRNSIARAVYHNANTDRLNKFRAGERGMSITNVDRLIHALGLYATLHKQQPQAPDTPDL